MAAGVPTIWTGLFHELKANPRDVSTIRALVVGGAAMPRALIEAYEKELGVNVLHAWGMTETSHDCDNGSEPEKTHWGDGHGERPSYFTRTRVLNSSNQLSTTLICGGGAACSLASFSGSTTISRLPSRAMS